MAIHVLAYYRPWSCFDLFLLKNTSENLACTKVIRLPPKSWIPSSDQGSQLTLGSLVTGPGALLCWRPLQILWARSLNARHVSLTSQVSGKHGEETPRLPATGSPMMKYWSWSYNTPDWTCVKLRVGRRVPVQVRPARPAQELLLGLGSEFVPRGSRKVVAVLVS